jgi:hypothetical protein
MKTSGQSKADFDKTYTCTYVESVSVFNFVDKIQNAYDTRGTSNWIIQFDGIDDLKENIIGKLSGLSRYFCDQVLKKQKQKIERRHTSTSMMMTLGDVLDRGYYIEPDYDIQSGNLPSGATLDERVVGSLTAAFSVLVVGEAGYGKTTILAKSFLRHVNMYLNKPSYNMPFYIGLKSRGGDYHFDINKYFDECFIDDLEKEKYPVFELDYIHPYFYLDGFDEVAEKLTNEELGKISGSSIINSPFLMTCRNQYALRYIRNIDFSDKIATRLLIKPWSITKAREYIENFCTIRNCTDLVFDINGLLTDNTELNDMLDNPLLITMLLWIIENNGLRVPETIKTRVHLFRECIEELAHRELGHLQVNTVSVEQLVRIWSFASWEVYYAKLCKDSVTFPKLLSSLHNYLKDIPNEYTESWFEALFVSNREQISGTFHEQFLEFLSANAILNACVCTSYPYPEFLSQVVRPEINRYFRELWQESPDEVKNNTIRNIKMEYTNNLLYDNSTSVNKRVHSVYHLSRLCFNDRDDFIYSALSKETNISVRLSLYFGAIKSGDLEIEEELYQLLLNNPEYSDANRGYHLTYYSDIIMDDKLPFKDNPAMTWSGTLDAFLRHFNSSYDRHYFLRRIELLTMQQLFDTRKNNYPLDLSKLQIIKKHVHYPKTAKYPEFQNKVVSSFNAMEAIWHKYERISICSSL